MTDKKQISITPYANESEAITIGDINIENRTDRITIYGNTDITRDKQGLQKAMAIKNLIDDILGVLQSEQLPDNIDIKKPAKITNPFTKTAQGDK